MSWVELLVASDEMTWSELVNDDPETRPFEEVQADALNKMESFLAETDDVNFQSKDLKQVKVIFIFN